jgi:hypothetical protein
MKREVLARRDRSGRWPHAVSKRLNPSNRDGDVVVEPAPRTRDDDASESLEERDKVRMPA